MYTWMSVGPVSSMAASVAANCWSLDIDLETSVIAVIAVVVDTQRFKPMFEPGKVSFIQDSLCWSGADVMGDRLKLVSFNLLDVRGREPGCPGCGM